MKDANKGKIELQAKKDSSTILETTVWIVELKPVKHFHKKSNVKIFSQNSFKMKHIIFIPKIGANQTIALITFLGSKIVNGKLLKMGHDLN